MVRKKENKIYYFIFGLFILSIVILVATFFLNNRVLYEERTFAQLFVGEPAGFDLNETIISFGRLPPTTSSERKINLSNAYEFPVVVEFFVEGNISDFIVIHKPVFLDGGENKQVFVRTINIPANATVDEYEGYLIIRFKKA